jgi:hypothetical protein
MAKEDLLQNIGLINNGISLLSLCRNSAGPPILLYWAYKQAKSLSVSGNESVLRKSSELDFPSTLFYFRMPKSIWGLLGAIATPMQDKPCSNKAFVSNPLERKTQKCKSTTT